MDFLTDLLWHHGNFLGIQWNVWKVIGWLGNATFFSRFVVQWYATEKKKQVVVPTAFWWLSLVGSFLLLCYALFGKLRRRLRSAKLCHWPFGRGRGGGRKTRTLEALTCLSDSGI